jgi:hypothetical protein
MKTEQAQSHGDNHSDCNSPPQKLLCDGLQPSTASANTLEHLGKSQNTLNDLLLGQYKCPNSSEHKIYLCDYQYEGHKWSIEISATSFEDAKKRLNALRYGEVVGELKLSVPVPMGQTWLNRLKKWVSSCNY